MTSGSPTVLEPPVSASTPDSVGKSAGTDSVEDCSVPKEGTGSTVETNLEFSSVGLSATETFSAQKETTSD